MKKTCLVLTIMMALSCSGCSWLAVRLTPLPVLDSVARGAAVANAAVNDPPKTEDDIKAYLQINKECWDELSKYFELK